MTKQNLPWKSSCLLAVGLVFLIAANVFAATRYVGTQPGDHSTIQAAVNAARNNDIVIVRNGTYNEANILMPRKVLTIKSASEDASLCTINCGGGTNKGFVFGGIVQNIQILELTIRNAGDSAIWCVCQAAPTITNCVIKESTTGIYCAGQSRPTVTGCTLTDNATGIYCTNMVSPIISEDLVTGGATGIVCTCMAHPNISSCDVTGSSIGIECSCSAYPTITDCDVTGTTNAGVKISNSARPVISECSITDNLGDGVSILLKGAAPKMTACLISGNGKTGIMCSQVSNAVIIDDCDILDNADNGIVCMLSSCPSIKNCKISGNGAASLALGGGVCCQNAACPVIVNCLVTENTAIKGGGIGCTNAANPKVTNCTITDNIAIEKGGALFCQFSACPIVTNSILWGNDSGSNHQVDIWSTTRPMVTYSLADCIGYHNLQPIWPLRNPCFVDADAGNYHLAAESPCINTGKNDAPGILTTDLDGNARIYPLDGTVDMGAYEYSAI